MASPNWVKGGNKNVTTAGTAVQLTTTSTPCKAVLIRAKAANTNNVYFGDSSVDNTYTYLSAYEWASIAVSDVSHVYIDSDTNGEGVTYSYLE